MSAAVAVQYGTRRPWAPGPPTLRRWAQAALEQGVPRARAATLCIRVVGAAEGRRLNRQYRGLDHATNVLSFHGDPAPVRTAWHLGDLVICAPVVASEARAQRKPLRAHWAHMVVHGTLHLGGYDHERPRQAGVMEARETEILAALGFAAPYEARDDD